MATRLPFKALRLSFDTQRRLSECRSLARLLGQRWTMDAVVRRAMMAHGVQLRRRCRQAGIDVEAALAKESGKVAVPFKGVEKPESGRVYGL